MKKTMIVVTMLMIALMACASYAMAQTGTPVADALGDVLTDTILPALVVLIGTLAALLMRKATQKLGIERNEAWERWASAQAEAAVQYAGEYAAARLKQKSIKLTSNEKLDLAAANLLRKVPGLTRDQATVLVHTALARISGEGATGDKVLVPATS